MKKLLLLATVALFAGFISYAQEPQTRYVRLDNEYLLQNGVKYAIVANNPHSTWASNPYKTLAYASNGNIVFQNHADLTSFAANEMFTFTLTTTYPCYTHPHNGKTGYLSNTKHFLPTTSGSNFTTSNANHKLSNIEFFPKQDETLGYVFRFHFFAHAGDDIRQKEFGINNNSVSGIFTLDNTKADSEYEKVLYNEWCIAFSMYMAVKEGEEAAAAQVFWNAEREEFVGTSEFGEDLVAKVLAATATLPTQDWTYLGVRDEVHAAFKAVEAQIVAENLNSITAGMIDEHFAETLAWAQLNGEFWTNEVQSLIDSSKRDITLDPQQTWTPEAILEYVHGQYSSLGISTTSDILTQVVDGKIVNIINGDDAFPTTYLATVLDSDGTDKFITIPTAKGGHTGFKLEKVEGTNYIRIKDVCNNKYFADASSTANAKIASTENEETAGKYYFAISHPQSDGDAYRDGSRLYIYGTAAGARPLHLNNNTTNYLMTYTGTYKNSQWYLRPTTLLETYNNQLASNQVGVDFNDYKRYGTTALVTNDAIGAAISKFEDATSSYLFTEDDELTPSTLTAKLTEFANADVRAAYTSALNDLWAGSVINDKQVVLKAGRNFNDNRFMSINSAGTALSGNPNDLHARGVWQFKHVGNGMYHLYNPQNDKYIKADRSLTDEANAESFYFVMPEVSDRANYVCIRSANTAHATQNCLHIQGYTANNPNPGFIYWTTSDVASRFYITMTDEDVAAAAKLTSCTIPDVSTYKSTADEGYAIGGYDAAMINLVKNAPTAASNYIDQNVGTCSVVELLNGRDEILQEAVTTAAAILATKVFPQDGMYITLTSSPENETITTEHPVATLFDNGNALTNSHMILEDYNNYKITEANKIWYYTGGKMINYATGHHLTTGTGTHMNVSTGTHATEAAALAAAKRVDFVNAYQEAHEFQMILPDGSNVMKRNIHIYLENDLLTANTCGLQGTKEEKSHNWHIDLVTELPIEIHGDGFGSFSGHVAFEIPETDNYVYYYAHKANNNKLIFEEAPAHTKFAAGNVIIVEQINSSEGVPSPKVNVLYTISEDDQLIPAHGISSIEANYLALNHANETGKVTFAKTKIENGTSTNQAPALRRVSADDYDKSVALTPVGTSKPVNILTLTMDNDDANIDANGRLIVPIGENAGITLEAIELHRCDGSSVTYDLQGRKLTQPVKGINIVNGRKVLVK